MRSFLWSSVTSLSSAALQSVAIILLLAPGVERAVAASRTPFLGTHIQKVMQEFGLPDGVKMPAHGAKTYEWHLRAAAEIQTEEGERRTEDLFCTVTIRVSPRERVTSIKTEVSSPSASLYASAGAFGCLCADSFGMNRKRQPRCERPPPFLAAVSR